MHTVRRTSMLSDRAAARGGTCFSRLVSVHVRRLQPLLEHPQAQPVVACGDADLLQPVEALLLGTRKIKQERILRSRAGITAAEALDRVRLARTPRRRARPTGGPWASGAARGRAPVAEAGARPAQTAPAAHRAAGAEAQPTCSDRRPEGEQTARAEEAAEGAPQPRTDPAGGFWSPAAGASCLCGVRRAFSSVRTQAWWSVRQEASRARLLKPMPRSTHHSLRTRGFSTDHTASCLKMSNSRSPASGKMDGCTSLGAPKTDGALPASPFGSGSE